MASQISQQYAFRAQKSLGLVNGTPDYDLVPGFTGPDVPARTFHYSADGRLFAYALPTVVRIYQAEGAQLLQELPLPNVIELRFSPRGTYLSTWERPVKLEDGTQHKNLRIFSVSTGEELTAFTQKSQEGWDVQYTISESHAIRLVSGEIQVYRPAEWSKGIVEKLKVEGATAVTLSPGLNPSVAVFVAEKKGAPASIKIYGLLSLNSAPTCQKSFFKADRAQIKWNTLGTQVLLLTQTEVDNSNKSYYGETGMYLLSAAGNFDCRITLDKEGPIHDFAWSPNSKEFGVVYGYMPAKTMIFDQRVRTLHDFGAAPVNTISFNPQGRLILLAGFGNLAGKIDVIDRRTLRKVCTIDAPNTSHCEWSPDGRFILTATLSPRLRVDNGVKIWHCSGPLLHIQTADELYQVAWRPTPVEAVPPFGQHVPPAPAPSESVRNYAALQKPAPAKPAGAYRPPGARGLATPAIFKREDEGGAPRLPTNGASTPPRGYNRSPHPPGAAPPNGQQNGYYGHGQNGSRDGGRRQVPGAAPRGQGASPGPEADRKGAARKRKGKKEGGQEALEVAVDSRQVSGTSTPAVQELAVAVDAASPVTPGPDTGALDPVAKKVRNLNKKLKAIEELKEKSKRGERLEATQLRKIDGEADIRKELAALGAAAASG
ncbi:putative functions in the early steps of protein synthesis of a small number of specific mRNAs [Lyophyllum shimeji]|uniref:Eukaryotic translation initiation factor 2A n=1 Tax=Lyophyllum shimeji TaxID=47721 RepID=A0A9P3PGY3_LYOSH|nr:putative functions in the early steps of protein synthesis of a small number of specific mRNAs [Lyophyllum shimeji]